MVSGSREQPIPTARRRQGLAYHAGPGLKHWRMVERQPLFISACLKRFFVVTQACEPTPYISTWTAGSQAASGVKQKIRLAGSALSWQIMEVRSSHPVAQKGDRVGHPSVPRTTHATARKLPAEKSLRSE